MHDCPYCECLPDLPPRNFETHPKTPFEETMQRVYGPLIEEQLRPVITFSRSE